MEMVEIMFSGARAARGSSAGVVVSVCGAAFLEGDDEAEEMVLMLKFSFSLLAEDDADFLTTPHRQRCVDELRVDSHP